MPIYSYRCNECGEKFDLLVGVTSDSVEKECPKCGNKKIEKTLTACSVRVTNNEPSCSTGTCAPVNMGCPTCH